MSVETESMEQPVAQSDAAEDAAIAEALAGYNARGAAPAPPVVTPEASVKQPDTPAEPQPNTEPVAEPGQAPESVPPAPTLEERLAAFKEEVKANAQQYSAEAVRKLHGDIGDINRKLSQIQATKADIPAQPQAPSPLDAALAEAERVAQDWPEVGGPLANALKLVAQQKAQEASPTLTQEEVDARAEARAAALYEARQQAAREEAVKVLKADHPDYSTVVDSAEFESWIKAKPADLQEVIRNTENPVLASRFMTEFKSTLQAKQKKHERLSNAITPSGVAAPAAPSQPTDIELAWAGYGKGGSRPVKQR